MKPGDLVVVVKKGGTFIYETSDTSGVDDIIGYLRVRECAVVLCVSGPKHVVKTVKPMIYVLVGSMVGWAFEHAFSRKPTSRPTNVRRRVTGVTASRRRKRS